MFTRKMNYALSWTHPKRISTTPQTHHSDFKQTNDQIYSFEMTKSFRFGSLQDQHGHILFTAIKRFQHWTRGTSSFFICFHITSTWSHFSSQWDDCNTKHSSTPFTCVHTTSSTLQLNWNIVIHFSFHCPPKSDTSFFQIQEPFLSHIRFPNRYHFNIFRISQFLFL